MALKKLLLPQSPSEVTPFALLDILKGDLKSIVVAADRREAESNPVQVSHYSKKLLTGHKARVAASPEALLHQLRPQSPYFDLTKAMVERASFISQR